MARIYVQLQVDFADDEKVARLARYGRDARPLRDLLVQMWCYCKREQSDGHVPAEIVGKLAYPDTAKSAERDADRLVDCEIAQRTPTGYYLPGYLKHNKSREQIALISAAKAVAGQKGGKASGLARSGEADVKQDASPPPSHSSDNKVQPSEFTSETSLGGNRPEPLRAVPATDPQTATDEERCTRHPSGNPSHEACRGCQRIEERKQLRADRHAEQERAIEQEAARACVRCEGTHFVLDGEKKPTREKCTKHRRTA